MDKYTNGFSKKKEQQRIYFKHTREVSRYNHFFSLLHQINVISLTDLIELIRRQKKNSTFFSTRLDLYLRMRGQN